MIDPASWTHNTNSSRHADGHKLMFYPMNPEAPELLGWWAYPFGRIREARGPFPSRAHAMDACDPDNPQAWVTAPIPFTAEAS